MVTRKQSTRCEVPLILALALAISIADGGRRCEAAQGYRARFHDIEVQLRTVKRELQAVNSRKAAGLTPVERRKLEDDLRTIVHTIDLDARELQKQGAKFGVTPKYREDLSPDQKLDRLVALLEANVDYCIMLAMQMQQAEATKDKDAADSMIIRLKSMEKNLRSAADVQSRALRKAATRIEKK